MPNSNTPPPPIHSLISAISPFLFLQCFSILTQKKMQEKDHLHHPGICQRMFNFITELIFPSLKRITDHAASVHDPLVNGVGSMDQHQQPKSLSKPEDDFSESAIEIHFEQTEEDLEHWTPIDKLGSSVHGEQYDQPQFKKGNNISSSSSAFAPANGNLPSDKFTGKRSEVTEPPRKKELQLPIVDVNGNGSSQHQVTKRADQPPQQQQRGERKPNLISLAQGRGPQNVVSRNKSTENKTSEILTVPIEIQKSRLRHPTHLLDVAPNINEKTDAYLKRRLEAMRKSHGSEREES
ncbi:hypothetical protein GH714_024456 [Hevea brasiliensis]|uniref:Uncharacterized protein n=1 Tax=Hevea brasiliensis TaxID=3981 RepID=A0A6A6LB45_HEVBR|nr:hypothetical protein GH714_024456 [Hevea brasiliensis]